MTIIPPVEELTIDALAQEIRRVDGENSLGAGALAEAIMSFIGQHRRAAEAGATDAVPVEIGYTNWRGEYAVRRIIPIRPWFGATEWHPEPQWLLTAIDVEKGAERDFAIADIGRTATPPATGVRVTVRPLEWERVTEEGMEGMRRYWRARDLGSGGHLWVNVHTDDFEGECSLGGTKYSSSAAAMNQIEDGYQARILSALVEQP